MKGFEGYKGRTAEHGQTVEVYRNLHNGKWSIRDKKSKLIVGHADIITVHDATFKVSKAGREKVLREKKKNVHAIVEGTLIAEGKDEAYGFTRPVRYNPYKYETFMCDGKSIQTTKEVQFSYDGAVKTKIEGEK